MQRGQGRGRGRNSHPSRSSRGRGIPSSRRDITASQTRSRATASLRRSARLAHLSDNSDDLTNGDVGQQQTNGSMADVARPRALGNDRSARSRHHSSRTPGRSRGGRHSISPEDIRYAMDVVLQPPPTARAGYPLAGSIIVRLRTTNTDPDDALPDSTNLVAVATLIPGPNSTAPSDPAVLNTLLAGRRFDSIHPFSDDAADGSIASMEMDDPRGVGFMLFSELVIRQPGVYRIRITLIRIRNSSTDPPVASAAGGASVQIVDSNPIVVQGGGASTTGLANYNGGPDEDDGGWMDVLRSMQTLRRSPAPTPTSVGGQ